MPVYLGGLFQGGSLTPLQGTRNTLHLTVLPRLYTLKRLIHVHRLSPGSSKSALPSEEGVNLFTGLARELMLETISSRSMHSESNHVRGQFIPRLRVFLAP